MFAGLQGARPTSGPSVVGMGAGRGGHFSHSLLSLCWGRGLTEQDVKSPTGWGAVM